MQLSLLKRKMNLFNVILILSLTILIIVFFALINSLGLMGKTGRAYVTLILASAGLAICIKEIVDWKMKE